MIEKPLTKNDIGKRVIHGIYNDDIKKSYGSIIDFNDDVVIVVDKRSKKLLYCQYEDLDYDFQDGELGK